MQTEISEYKPKSDFIGVLDTETTGVEAGESSIVELAVVGVQFGITIGIGDKPYSSLVKPRHAISIEARATHHITDEEIEKKGIDYDEALIMSGIGDGSYAFLAAHNCEFDSKFIESPLPWICTYRCAQHLWPTAPRYSNQVLRYWLEGLNAELIKDTVGLEVMKLPPHRALPDAWVTAHILTRMLRVKTPQELVELTKAPILQTKVRFGKHFGLLWSEVPKSYLQWVIGQNFDNDTLHTAQHYLTGGKK